MGKTTVFINTRGFKFHPQGQKAILKYRKPDYDTLFEFIPEDDNEYDENAVALYFNGIKAAYVAREDAELMRKIIEEYPDFKYNIVELVPYEDPNKIAAIVFAIE